MWRHHLILILLLFGNSFAQTSSTPYELLQELRDHPAFLQGAGGPSPDSIKRNAVYAQLLEFDQAAVLALAQALGDPDARIRQQSALALMALGSGYLYEDGERQPALDISAALEELTLALADSDGRVRELSAHAIGTLGPMANAAVPGLIAMLESSAEGDRNSAAIGLRGIGPGAQAALPALERALSDVSEDVRHFARLAIEGIMSE